MLCCVANKNSSNRSHITQPPQVSCLAGCLAEALCGSAVFFLSLSLSLSLSAFSCIMVSSGQIMISVCLRVS